jgi:predicted DNA-binding transcriptional regulator YafY
MYDAMSDKPMAGDRNLSLKLPGRPNPHLAVARVDRQHRLIEALEARSPRYVSVRQLATDLEVSARTVERDVASLVTAGVAISAKRGRAGGYAIAGIRQPAPLRLTRDELAVLITAIIGLGDYASGTARRALAKCLSAHHGDDSSSVE